MSLILRVFDPLSFDLRNQFCNLQLNISGGGKAVQFAAAQIDWKEMTEAHVFKADVLQINGEHSREKEEKIDTWHRVERSSGKFRRRFCLPENAKLDQI